MLLELEGRPGVARMHRRIGRTTREESIPGFEVKGADLLGKVVLQLMICHNVPRMVHAKRAADRREAAIGPGYKELFSCGDDAGDIVGRMATMNSVRHAMNVGDEIVCLRAIRELHRAADRSLQEARAGGERHRQDCQGQNRRQGESVSAESAGAREFDAHGVRGTHRTLMELRPRFSGVHQVRLARGVWTSK